MSGSAWCVLPGRLYIASADALPQVPCGPKTVLCLRRRAPQPGDYPAEWSSAHIEHLPLTYWADNALPLLHEAVRLALTLPGPVVAHCVLGLDRCGLLALAVRLHLGDSLAAALTRYSARGVRLPDGEAMSLLSHYASKEMPL